jgi:pimeloyl-ACP methyl ester carboxylesterase
VTPETLEGYYRPTRMRGHLRALAQQLSDRHDDELLGLERIQQHVLVLWGEHDGWLPPAHGRALVRQLPHAEWLAIPAAGHLPLEEQPDVCNQALLAFLDARAPAPAAEQPAGAEPSRLG